jgi:aspartate carbamoyltransferase catalytic subunit
MRLERKDLLGLEDLSAREIMLILDTAKTMKEQAIGTLTRPPSLSGKTVLNLFYEASTRTRTSFELAGKRLGANVVNFNFSASSMSKGETLKDTVLNLQAMNPHFMVVRHSVPGVAKLIADTVPASVINAGDGSHEHPSQALLDLFTIKEQRGSLAGLEVAIVGDIAHSRVARSNIWGLTTLGARVRVAGPLTMIPPHLEKLGVRVYSNLDEALAGVDVIICLRIQLERQNQHLFPTLGEYARFFGINRARLRSAKKNVMIMHPGPINRGVEITSELADGNRSFILAQVTNGVAVRMALFHLLAGEGRAAAH